MIGILFVIKVPDASYQRTMSLFFCPINRLFLSIEFTKYVVCMVFNHIALNG